jgi:ElaB/YqjD/DUF883 family membrane-anchored ribosome-binding protein
MEPSTKKQPQPVNTTVTKMASASPESGQKVAETVSNAVHSVREEVVDRGGEAIDQAKQKVSEVYEQTNKHVSEQYKKAVDYGRENPGKTTLIALGVGIGIGLLLSGVGGSRNRRNRMVEPVMGALTTFAREMFR